MFNDSNKLRVRYVKQIEDGRRIEAFTSMPEWQWYVEHVINPTIEDYTQRILSGSIPSDKEDWVIRGMIMGMKLVTESASGLKNMAEEAKKKIKAQEEYEKD